jgi:hypothetical protein
MKEVEVKEVVITTLARAGKGVQGDPIRKVIQIWEKDGSLIAERDEFLLERIKEPYNGPSRIEEFNLNMEPEILAAFPKILKHGLYPSREWYIDVLGSITPTLKHEPKGVRYDILEKTVKWLDKKIQSMP